MGAVQPAQTFSFMLGLTNGRCLLCLMNVGANSQPRGNSVAKIEVVKDYIVADREMYNNRPRRTMVRTQG
jgi:hypothetical protein